MISISEKLLEVRTDRMTDFQPIFYRLKDFVQEAAIQHQQYWD